MDGLPRIKLDEPRGPLSYPSETEELKIEFTHKKEFESGNVAACSFLRFESMDRV